MTSHTGTGAPMDRDSGTLTRPLFQEGTGGAGEGTDGAGRNGGADPGVPSRIGRYTVLELIGRGGMGRVYLAHDRELDRHIAVKVLDGAPDQTGRLALREAQSLAKLSHPNVVAVYEVGFVDGRVFIAMEHVHGRTLSAWLREPRSIREILEAFVQAGRGLAAAHRAGIVHRDFKLSNAMIDGKGRVRVLDFGVAHLEDATSAGQPAWASDVNAGGRTCGEILGTPHFMAPEQHRGDPITAAADQYAFCVSLWQALYGSYPFEGTMDALYRAKERWELQEPPTTAGVPRRLRRALERGLAFAPAERFPSMDALVDELSRRRSRSVAFLVPVATATLVAVGLGWSGSDARACHGGEESIAQVWSPARARAVHGAFEHSGLSYAEQTWERIAPMLDTYAKRWASAHRQVCESGARSGTEAEQAELDRRMACLSERRQRLASLVDVLANAEPSAVRSAVGNIERLADAAECVASPLDQLRGSAPHETSGPRHEVRRLLHEVAAQREAGHLEQALAGARAAHEQTEAVGDPMLSLEALLELGSCLLAMGSREEAGEVLREAFFLAREQRDGRASNAALGLVSLHTNLADYDEAEAWIRHAEAAIEQVEHRAAPEYELISRRGGVYSGRGEHEAARTEFERATELAEREFGPRSSRVAEALHNLAIPMLRMGEVTEAREALQRSVSIKRELYGPAHPEVADAGAVLANSYLYDGQYAEALRRLEQAYEVHVAAAGAENDRAAGMMSNMAVALISLGRTEEARGKLEQALRITEKTLGPTHPNVAIMLGNLGSISRGLGDLDEARECYERAIAIVESTSGTDSDPLIELRLNVGNVIAAQGEHAEALPHYERALAIAEASLGPEHPLVGHTCTAAGIAWTALDKPLEALPLLERALTIRMNPEIAPVGRAEVQYHLGVALWNSGRNKARARKLVTAAHDELGRAEASEPRLRELVTAWLDEHGSSASSG